MAKPLLRRFRLRTPGARKRPAVAIGRQATLEHLEPRILLSAAALDATFDGDGVATIDFGAATSGTDLATTVLTTADQIILVGGSSSGINKRYPSLARYNALDGSLDPTFGDDGRVLSLLSGGEWYAGSAVLDPAGGIIVAGYRYNASDPTGFGKAVLLRYDSSGNLDATFGDGGVVTEDFGATDARFRGIRLHDGKLVVSGEIGIGGGLSDVLVARFNLDGTLDTSFGGGDGWATANAGQIEAGEDLAIDSQGRIYVAGSYGFLSFSTRRAVIWRFDGNGAVDSTFDTDGVLLVTPVVTQAWFHAIEVDSQDRVVAGGFRQSATNGFIVRVDAAGAIDAGFGVGGFTYLNDVRDLAIDSQQRIVAAFYTRNANVARLTPDGAFDSSFGVNGIYTGPLHAAESVAIDAAGRIVTGGWQNNNNFLLSRVTAEGVADVTLDSDGWLVTDMLIPAHQAGVQTIVLPDGKLLVGGVIDAATGPDIVISRHHADGTLDLSFGGGDGWVTVDLKLSDKLGGIAIDQLGRIVIAGTGDTANPYSPRAYVARLTGDGELDTTFNGTGKILLSFNTTNPSGANAVQIDSQNRIVIVGQLSVGGPDAYGFLLARLLPNGAFDTTINGTGWTQVAGSVASPAIFTDVEVLPDDSMLSVGYDRTSANGASFHISYIPRDLLYHGQFYRIVDFAGFNDLAFAVTRDAQGRVLAAGYATMADGSRQMAATRLTPQGQIDTTFGVNGRVMIPVGASAEAHDVIAMPDGTILLVGHTTSASGESDLAVARLLPDGQLDATFDGDGVLVSDLGGQETIVGAALDSQLRLIVTGGIARERINDHLLLARLHTSMPDGNDAPVGNADNYGISHDRVLSVAAAGVLGNDADVDGDAMTALLETGPAHGSLLLNIDGSFTYTPDAGYTGSDSFTYRASDGLLTSSVVTVALNIYNYVPVAATPSPFVTIEDVPVQGAVTASDIDGDDLTLNVTTGPTNGSLAFNADGTFVYTPNPKYHGSDFFWFQASDGVAASTAAKVQIIVTSVNEKPIAQPDSYTVPFGKTFDLAHPGIVANDYDGDGDALEVHSVRYASHGSLTLFRYSGRFIYTPFAGYTGPDSFEYRLFDGTEYSDPVMVTLDVVNTPPVVQDLSLTVNEDQQATVTVTTATDAENNPLKFSVVDGPANGIAYVDSWNRLVYRGAANWSGVDTFTYKANDGADDSNLATVTVTVNPVNDAPQAVSNSYSVVHDRELAVAADVGVLANDSDIEGSPLAAVLVTGPACGTLTLNADGSFTYVPQAGYVGNDSFTYRATDGAVASSIATVTIKVTNQAPTAQTLSYDTDRNVSFSGQLAGADADGDAITYTHTQPANGSVVVNPDGSFVYTPKHLWWGVENFQYKVSDGITESSWRYVVVGVNYVYINDHAPVAQPEHYQMRQGDVLNVPNPGLLANDSDADENPLSIVIVDFPDYFWGFTYGSGGSISYVPHPLYTGTDTFTYYVSDEVHHSETVTVTIDVLPFRAPSSVASTVSGSSVTLNWIDNGSGFTDGFIIERAAKTKGKTAPSYQQVGTVTGTTFTEASVPSGTWLYRVAAFDGSYYSPYSTPLQVSVGSSDGGGGGGKPGKNSTRLASDSSTSDALLLAAMDDQYRTQTTSLSPQTSTTTEPTIDLLGLLESEATVEVKVKKRQ